MLALATNSPVAGEIARLLRAANGLAATALAQAPCFGATASEPQKGVSPAVCRSRDGSGVFNDNYRTREENVKRFPVVAAAFPMLPCGP